MLKKIEKMNKEKIEKEEMNRRKTICYNFEQYNSNNVIRMSKNLKQKQIQKKEDEKKRSKKLNQKK